MVLEKYIGDEKASNEDLLNFLQNFILPSINGGSSNNYVNGSFSLNENETMELETVNGIRKFSLSVEPMQGNLILEVSNNESEYYMIPMFKNNVPSAQTSEGFYVLNNEITCKKARIKCVNFPTSFSINYQSL